MSKRTLHTPVWLAIFVVTLALVVGGVAGAMTSGPVFSVAAAAPEGRVGLQGSFADVVKAVTPSVVNIWSSKIVKAEGDEELSPF